MKIGKGEAFSGVGPGATRAPTFLCFIFYIRWSLMQCRTVQRRFNHTFLPGLTLRFCFIATFLFVIFILLLLFFTRMWPLPSIHLCLLKTGSLDQFTMYHVYLRISGCGSSSTSSKLLCRDVTPAREKSSVSMISKLG